ncbi:hypothetical protein HanPSC8_Chr01g0006761 [Helianthus annuus]|nr:hypothetical protein HanPSC8_Chr01g0006761 [Helianthus annuus]
MTNSLYIDFMAEMNSFSLLPRCAGMEILVNHKSLLNSIYYIPRLMNSGNEQFSIRVHHALLATASTHVSTRP